MKNIVFGVCLISGVLTEEVNYSPTVTTPRVYQANEFFPNSRFTFQYNIYDEDGDYVTILFQLSRDQGETWYTPRHVSGEIGHGIRSHIVPVLYYDSKVDSAKKELYSIKWNIPGEPWWDIKYSDLEWRIVADDHFEQPKIMDWVTVPADHEELTNTYHDERKFHMMKYEVTNRQYVDFLNLAYQSGMLSVTNDWVGYYKFGDVIPESDTFCYINQVVGDGNWRSMQWDGKKFSITKEAGDFPVIFITLKGAQAFADFYGWQLPTREQWTRSALGFLEMPFPWGYSVEYEQANFWNSEDPYDNGPTPVGYYNGKTHGEFETWDSPGRYGCYDMVGNVREWLRDSTVTGSSWYTINLREINSQNGTAMFDDVGADYQTGFRCVVEFLGR